MHKLNGIIAGITIRGLTSPARLELGEPRDVSLRILFAQSIVMPQNLPMGAYAMHATIAVSFRSGCARKQPSQKRPETWSSLFPRRAIGSAKHRINHEISFSRRRFSFSPLVSLRMALSSNSVGSAGVPFSFRRCGNKRHHRRATSSSDQAFTISGRVLTTTCR